MLRVDACFWFYIYMVNKDEYNNQNNRWTSSPICLRIWSKMTLTVLGLLRSSVEIIAHARLSFVNISLVSIQHRRCWVICALLLTIKRISQLAPLPINITISIILLNEFYFTLLLLYQFSINTMFFKTVIVVSCFNRIFIECQAKKRLFFRPVRFEM